MNKSIGKLKMLINEGELNKNSVVAKFATTASDGKVYQMEHYNLDMSYNQPVSEPHARKVISATNM